MKSEAKNGRREKKGKALKMDGDRMIHVIVMRLHFCLYCCIIIALGEHWGVAKILRKICGDVAGRDIKEEVLTWGVSKYCNTRAIKWQGSPYGRLFPLTSSAATERSSYTTTSSMLKIASERATCPMRYVRSSRLCALATMLPGSATETV
jgi:hypothetical protein